MMRDLLFKKNSAMTLTELLIASALVGVVMIGALSADFAIRTWQKRIEQRTMVQMDLMRAMEEFITDGRSANNGNIICWDENPYSWEDPVCKLSPASAEYVRQTAIRYRYVDYYYIIFRHDRNLTSNNDNDIISSVYYCYPPRLRKHVYTGTNLANITTPIYTVSSLTNADCFTVERDGNNYVTNIQVKLCSRPDPNKDVNPLTNPEYCLSSSFFPPALSYSK